MYSPSVLATILMIVMMSYHARCSTIGSRAHSDPVTRGLLAAGEARYYNLATGAQTACGGYHQSSEMICAAGASVFGDGDHLCGRRITIYHGYKQVTCALDDKCPSCVGQSLDLSPAVFKALAPMSEGVLNVCPNQQLPFFCKKSGTLMNVPI
ncbi:hypothetical protein VP01_1080g18 [Puccinia sorghi]|uniref:RlpA-like protein double-psi beta-barrel domain-containing protein n=1 Tax=Puccinia sorghi TaxID=27349 RepID=A0A0L6VTD4_9BASI|nr:hypothetical protein VP01_1080g18 [Puccinia sorghi]